MNGSCLLKDETEFDNLFFLLWHPMKNRHPLKIEKSDKCHYNGLIRRYFTSLLLLTHSSRS